jgi:hypothetical protein
METAEVRAGADYPWDAVEAELLAFTGDEKVDEHDDVVDTLSYAVKLVSGNLAAGPADVPRATGGVPWGPIRPVPRPAGAGVRPTPGSRPPFGW